MRVLKLTCAGCSAPLEIGDDIERFTCSYCRTPQLVERSGGVVVLKKLEGAISAVQRGTDRTAAELAIPRLTKELAEALRDRSEAFQAAKKVRESAMSGRRLLTSVVAIFIFFGGLAALATAGDSNVRMQIYAWVWLFVQLAIPVYVFRKVKLPPDMSREKVAPWDAKVERIQAQIKANRAILDELPI